MKPETPTLPSSTHALSAAAIEGVYQAIFQRRDIRHFVPGPLPEGCLDRLLNAAHAGPSVGYMQPWRFLHVTDSALRQSLVTVVDAEREKTAQAMCSRQEEFMRLKVEGVRECAEILVVALMNGRDPHIFGRRTLPTMDLASASCAIQNLWLAARAEGIGVGWVSIFEPSAVAKLLNIPAGAEPIAILCLGQVAEFPAQPMLETLGWGNRLPREQWLFENTWPADARPTPVRY